MKASGIEWNPRFWRRNRYPPPCSAALLSFFCCFFSQPKAWGITTFKLDCTCNNPELSVRGQGHVCCCSTSHPGASSVSLGLAGSSERRLETHFFSSSFHQLMFVSTPNPLIRPALTDFAGATCESALSSHFSQSAILPLVTSSFTTPSPIQRGSLSLFHPHFMQFLTPIQFRLLFPPPSLPAPFTTPRVHA